MGHPSFRAGIYLGAENDRRRIAVVSPFVVDLAEATGADVRSAGLATSGDPTRWNGVDPAVGLPNGDEASGCLYTEDGALDALPVNCISRDLAQAICASRGGTLPSEAQLVWLIGGLRGRTRPWGNDDPVCGDAVFARSRSPFDDCFFGGRLGPLPPGSTARDRVAVGDRDVVDVAGNVSEWAADVWSGQDDPCWGSGVFVDPRCTAPPPNAEPDGVAIAGTWVSDGTFVHAASRLQIFTPSNGGRGTGFRCVRPATSE
jgi:formylglycine-generating enzyme required for sulfatase activity